MQGDVIKTDCPSCKHADHDCPLLVMHHREAFAAYMDGEEVDCPEFEQRWYQGVEGVPDFRLSFADVRRMAGRAGGLPMWPAVSSPRPSEGSERSAQSSLFDGLEAI